MRFNATTNDFPFREMCVCRVEKGNRDETMELTAISEVRSEWLYEAARMSQEILCEARARGPSARELVGAFGRLPDASSPVERLVRQGIILDVLLGCVADPSRSQDERTINVVGRILAAVTSPSPLLESPECRAAALIKEHAALRLKVPEIARAVGCHPSHLRRRFYARYAITMRDWHTRCRVMQALLIYVSGETKTSAVGRAVGSRSDKNFYRALRRVTGRTPAEIKLMSKGALTELSREVSVSPGLLNADCWFDPIQHSAFRL
jgi:AraC-like DNA-binding protein